MREAQEIVSYAANTDNSQDSILSKKSSWGKSFRKYFGANSTGVRNWLLLVAILTFILILLSGPYAVVTIPGTILLGLTITLGIFACIGAVAAITTLIGATLADYKEHKALHPEKNYLLSLVLRLKDWVVAHPFQSIFIALCFIPLVFAIPELIVASGAAIVVSLAATLALGTIMDALGRFFGKLHSIFFPPTVVEDQFTVVKSIYRKDFRATGIDASSMDTQTIFMEGEIVKPFIKQHVPEKIFNQINFKDADLLVEKNKITGKITYFSFENGTREELTYILSNTIAELTYTKEGQVLYKHCEELKTHEITLKINKLPESYKAIKDRQNDSTNGRFMDESESDTTRFTIL